MATIVCSNKTCKYNKGGIGCDRDFVMVTMFGQCSIWYNKNGSVRQTPDYREPDQSGINQTSAEGDKK